MLNVINRKIFSVFTVLPVTILLGTVTVLLCMDEVAHEFEPKSGSNIVIIGNTFAEQLQNHNYFESLLYRSYPDSNLTIRNLAWSADEVNLRPRPLNFGSVYEHLDRENADYIFAFYGLNEAFQGKDSLDRFKTHLSDYLNEIKQHKYNGESEARIILFSPIAYENVGGLLPDSEPQNDNIALYTDAMRSVAGEHGIPFVNLFEPTQDLMSGESEKLTHNGIHLNDRGYRKVSEIMARKLGLNAQSLKRNEQTEKLVEAINIKNQQYFYKYRAVNGEYIYGRRNKPYGVKTFPPERRKIEQMVSQLDSLIWKGVREGNSISLSAVKDIVDYTDQYTPLALSEDFGGSRPKVSTESFDLKDGYKVELFASARNFPIGNPTQLSFDPKGRLWVSTIQSFPQKLPGSLPNDKLVVLEDTNQDGKADKHTVFADSLYEPLGFALGDGGVYLSQPPNLVFLKDTTGDLRADMQKPLLHGFGTEDIHHAISAFEWGPDGALYFQGGTFLHSQVETPYGPVRSAYGTTWRYEPYTKKLTRYISYPYSNPWGNVFTKGGIHLIGDASPGRNYYATPLTVAIDYPYKHMRMDDFPISSQRVLDGTEIMSSRAFPESVQGNYLQTALVNFVGVKSYEISKKGSGIIAHEVEPILKLSEEFNTPYPYFTPVDAEIGPDGALYLLDFANPMIGHTTHSFRDSRRDHIHGRVWRITHKDRELLEPLDLTQLDISELLDQLKVYEKRVRYRARIQLRDFPIDDVIRELDKWVENLDQDSSEYDQYRLEALWMYQQFHEVDEQLLKDLLKSSDKDIRAAATRVAFYARESLSNAQEMLSNMAEDNSQRVRLEAISALNHFENEESVRAILSAMEKPIDYYLYYALNESFKHLRPVWMEMFAENKQFLQDEPEKAFYLLSSVTSEKSLAIPGFIEQDPESSKFRIEPFDGQDYQNLSDVPAVVKFWIGQNDISDSTRMEGLRFLSEVEDRNIDEVMGHRLAFLQNLKTEFDSLLNWKASKPLEVIEDKQENQQLLEHITVMSRLLNDQEIKQGKKKTKSNSDISLSAQKGQKIAQDNACMTCHSTDGTGIVGPTWQNLFGSEVQLQSGETVIADEEYLRESIFNPKTKRVEGYGGAMPKYDYLSDSQVNSIIEYIKSLSDEGQ